MIAVNKRGERVKVGDEVVDFRGTPATVLWFDSVGHDNVPGMLTVRWESGHVASYNEVAFDLTVMEDDDAQA